MKKTKHYLLTATAAFAITAAAPLSAYAALNPFSCNNGIGLVLGGSDCLSGQNLGQLLGGNCSNSQNLGQLLGGNCSNNQNLGQLLGGNCSNSQNLGQLLGGNCSNGQNFDQLLGQVLGNSNSGNSNSGNQSCPTIPSLPDCTPGAQCPDFQIPDFQFPDVQVPDFQIPDVEVPDFQFPDIQFPDFQTPGSQNQGSQNQGPQNQGSQNQGSQNQGSQNQSSQNPGNVQDSYADQVVALVNQQRAAAGLSQLTVNYEVAASAMTRAYEIERYFEHTRPDGRGFYTALTDAGISYNSAGENIAYGQKSAEEVMTAWMNSSGHRANILNSGYTQIGVAHYKNASGTDYWVQLFIR